jgi:hypothetical protein
MVGVFFYTNHRFGWTLLQNFLLAAGQGVMYVVGSLLASRVSEWCGSRTRTLVGLYLTMTLLAILGLMAQSPVVVTIILLAYTLVCSFNWPALESLVAAGADAHEMSRRIGTYNLVWAGLGAVVVAVNGTIIDHWPTGVFLIPVIVHGLSAVLMLAVGRETPPDADAQDHHTEAPAALQEQRNLALWLSRISLPATYVVIYSLMAMMPSLPLLHDLSTAQRTALGSVWVAARWVAFLLLGMAAWWHTRPKLLLAAAVLMLVAFLGIVWRPGDVIAGLPIAGLTPYLWMVAWQCALGAALGMIYSGSLYFGMVVSEGSTEHGGYHEALIGLGGAIGPGAGALTQALFPGSLTAGILAVAVILGLSVLAAGGATLRLSRRAQ